MHTVSIIPLMAKTICIQYIRTTLTVNAAVGSVGSSAQAGGTVNLDVLDDKSVNVQSLIVCVGLGILQQLQEELCRLLGPTTLCRAKLLGLQQTITSINTVHPH